MAGKVNSSSSVSRGSSSSSRSQGSSQASRSGQSSRSSSNQSAKKMAKTSRNRAASHAQKTNKTPKNDRASQFKKASGANATQKKLKTDNKTIGNIAGKNVANINKANNTSNTNKATQATSPDRPTVNAKIDSYGSTVKSSGKNINYQFTGDPNTFQAKPGKSDAVNAIAQKKGPQVVVKGNDNNINLPQAPLSTATLEGFAKNNPGGTTEFNNGKITTKGPNAGQPFSGRIDPRLDVTVRGNGNNIKTADNSHSEINVQGANNNQVEYGKGATANLVRVEASPDGIRNPNATPLANGNTFDASNNTGFNNAQFLGRKEDQGSFLNNYRISSVDDQVTVSNIRTGESNTFNNFHKFDIGGTPWSYQHTFNDGNNTPGGWKNSDTGEFIQNIFV